MRTGTKKNLLAAVLVLVLAGTFAFVGSAKLVSAARPGDDCSTNSIDREDRNGGCGARTGAELIADIRDNRPSDLQTIFAHFGLTADKYERFANTAKMGTAHSNGTIVVDGVVVATDARSYGRETWPGQRATENIGGKIYYHSAMRDSFADGTTSLPVLVMFNHLGIAEVMVLTPCGNPVKAVVPKVACKQLNIVARGDDNYDFTSEVAFSGGARLVSVTYNFGDGSPTVTRTNPAEVVSHHFTQSATITVTANFVLPGGKTVSVTADACMKKVVVKKEVPPPTPPKPPVTPPALPVTGAGDALGIFAATSAGGAIAHRLIWRRRNGR